jgi:hypothetical protein
VAGAGSSPAARAAGAVGATTATAVVAATAPTGFVAATRALAKPARLREVPTSGPTLGLGATPAALVAARPITAHLPVAAGRAANPEDRPGIRGRPATPAGNDQAILQPPTTRPDIGRPTAS